MSALNDNTTMMSVHGITHPVPYWEAQARRRVNNEIEKPVREAYQKMCDIFGISDVLDSQELFEELWDIANDFHVHGQRPITIEERLRITEGIVKATAELYHYWESENFPDVREQEPQEKDDWLGNLNHNLSHRFNLNA